MIEKGMDICASLPGYAAAEPESRLRFLLLGTCQVAPFGGAFTRLGHIADHLLWESRTYDPIPQVADGAIYDANIVCLTLRQIFEDGVQVVYPETAHNLMEVDAYWPKIIADGKMPEFFEACSRKIENKIRAISSALGERPSFFFAFAEPRRNYMGRLFPRYDLNNIAYFVQQLNKTIYNEVAKTQNFYFCDINDTLNEHGRHSIQDDYLYSITHAAFIHDFVTDVRHETLRLTKPTRMTELYGAPPAIAKFVDAVAREVVEDVRTIRKPLTIKLIIVDLDDTLWRGVAADKDGLTWDDLEGWPLGFIEALLVFKARGGMLAISSKNDREPTLERFRKHFKQGLKIEDFASVQISFNPKSEQIASILAEVNVLPENVLFIDDNPREISEVKATFPSMKFLCEEPYGWRRNVLLRPETQVARLNSESNLRTASIQAKIQRDTMAKEMPREVWLKSLEIEQQYAIVATEDDKHFGRAFELLNKTNQFNTTARRWTREEMLQFLADGGYLVCSFLKDKFVDNGLIAVHAVKANEILQVVLSCRVFGLGAEFAIAHHLFTEILKNHGNVVGYFQDSGKNFTCKDYFLKMNFSDESGRFIGTTAPACPAHITLSAHKDHQTAALEI
ncbi:HAD-IIIC family phosphatase [Paraburkholderia bannensis]|uniref:HAD-IIIC family phosphatase n=1 Tax=Paraburkholderia bannensis TaxID=765414 RepID=UPI002AB1E65D|nr:HAD-IIIC family phosphatase [Paraburkholderia bannensis]